MHSLLLDRARFVALVVALTGSGAGCAPVEAHEHNSAAQGAVTSDGRPADQRPARSVPPAYESLVRSALREIEGRVALAGDRHVDTRIALDRALERLAFGGRDLEEGYRLAMRSLVSAFPIGHLVVYPGSESQCGAEGLPMASSSLVDACPQPFGDHVVISMAATGNPLELERGDEIMAVDGKSGAAMLDAAFAQPMCAGGSPSLAHRRALSATSLLSAVRVGSVVSIRHANGATESKTLARLTPPRACHDPLGRDVRYAAQASLRTDGAAVIHIPSFFPPDNDAADVAGSLERFRTAIRVEFQKVQQAPWLVIDVRGNRGGYPDVSMAIAAGLPGARPLAKAIRCQSRVPFTQQYGGAIDYDFAPSNEFEYRGKVAILSDGLSFSATDYFLRVVRLATSAIVVGRPSAGAYGGSESAVALGVANGPGAVLFPDPWRCTDAAGQIIEGQNVRPDLEEDLLPTDLAQGVDTDVETAVRLLRR